MIHAISPSGTIHKVSYEWTNHSVEVLCGTGDNTWGNKWRRTSKKINCKRCLAMMNPDKYGSVMVSKKDIRRYVKLIANIKEELVSAGNLKGTTSLLRRLSRLQNELHSKILPSGIKKII